jgi:hypothetical protein
VLIFHCSFRLYLLQGIDNAVELTLTLICETQRKRYRRQCLGSGGRATRQSSGHAARAPWDRSIFKEGCVVEAPSNLRQDVQHRISQDLNMTGKRWSTLLRSRNEFMDVAGSFLHCDRRQRVGDPYEHLAYGLGIYWQRTTDLEPWLSTKEGC